MKAAFYLITILFIPKILCAQSTRLLKDTINIYGYLCDSEGRPVRGVVYSKKARIVLEKTKTFTATDTNGKFQLTGISPTDTLGAYSSQGVIEVCVEGARYLKIKLPKNNHNYTDKGIIVKAQRIHDKKIREFEVVKTQNDNGIFVDFFNSAEFPGGMSRFLEIINSSLRYTKNAIHDNIEGTVIVSFKINVDGIVSDVDLVRGLGYGLDEQVIEAIKQSPKWKPEIFSGAPTASEKYISIEFKLTNEKK